MEKCKATTKTMKLCTRNAIRNGYCRQHGQAEKIIMFKKELAKLHERVRFYSQKANAFRDQIELIQRLDYIKVELLRIGGPDRAFKFLVADPRYRDELEDLFDISFEYIADTYRDMLSRRNELVHKFSSQFWSSEKPIRKISHNPHFLYQM
jgi:hypothetical protein